MNKKIFILFCVLTAIVLLTTGCPTTYTKSEVDDMIAELDSTTAKIVGWGVIMNNGTILSGSGNYTVTKNGAGTYEIYWTGSMTILYSDYIFMATSTSGAGSDINVTFTTFGNGTALRFYTTNTAGALTDSTFSFAVMKK